MAHKLVMNAHIELVVNEEIITDPTFAEEQKNGFQICRDEITEFLETIGFRNIEISKIEYVKETNE